MNTMWITLIGGVCLLIYGLNVTRDHLQLLAGEKLRDILEKLTENRFIAFLTGFVMTLVLQSSSATIAMAVGFASSQLLTLTQSMAIILGADVGTTLTVQLLAFNLANYSLLIITLGFILTQILSAKKKSYGSMILGIGFIFLGMWMISQATASFKDAELLLLLLNILKTYPFIALMCAAIVTASMQSSAAFLGILLSMSHTGILPLTQALPLVIGANIGGCALPLIVSLKTTDIGRQVSMSHLALKVCGAMIIFPFLSGFENIVMMTSSELPRQIANAHFLFNFAVALIFMPSIQVGAHLMNKIYPLEPQPEPFGPKYLDLNVISTPSFALAQAKRETLRFSSIIEEMLEKTMVLIKTEEDHLAFKMKELERQSDILYRAIKKYLIKVSQESLTEAQADHQLLLVMFTNDLEDIGDTIDRSILPLAKIKMRKSLKFSKEGFDEIKTFHRFVMQNFHRTISAFTNNDASLYQEVVVTKEKVQNMELRLRETHLDRLRKGVQESIDTSALHLELLTQFRRINSAFSNIALHVTQEQKD
ncbi:MAG: hypothetical protein A3B70_08780 [Deltaproteobacteria bacterium RIFCSPHIGHO2_02_FULL_40_11]|nr:MAG: hypothetical protein A3B70_08780 [Deltaproteobacteria bacterium RIFCSPHIGHO2_02_FULL_40_11]